jgi:hypothetical protein
MVTEFLCDPELYCKRPDFFKGTCLEALLIKIKEVKVCVCVCARAVCVCARALCVCVRARYVCVCARAVCACARALCVCVCARARVKNCLIPPGKGLIAPNLIFLKQK